jgi:hypothetical protein
MRYSPPFSIPGARHQVTMRRAIVSLGLALGSLLAAATPGNAQVPPPISNRPAATLLLPYFEVDLDNGQGLNTIFSVNNSSATAVLAHVAIWSDMGVPVLNFDVYLSGFDTQRIDLRSVLLGNVPQTASVGQDPGNVISPQGIISQDINFASCTGTLPATALSAGMVAHVRAALTGKPSPVLGGMCASRDHGTPSIARGYITVDTVTQCSSMFPSEPGYFSGVASYQNVLWGEYMMVDASREFAFADPLVHILADWSGVSDPDLVLGRYTFYGRFVAWTAIDRREPLSTKFQTRFIAPKDFKTAAKTRRRPFLPPGTELMVWRDPKTPTANAFSCASKPTWFPLNHTQVMFFNEQEAAEQLSFDALPFPGATQRVTVASADLPVTFASGMIHLNLNTFVVAGPGPPLVDPSTSQSWITVLQRALQGPNGGRYEAGFRAIRLDSARNPDLSFFF